MLMNYNTVPSDEVIEKTIAALQQNGITAEVVENAEEAKKRFLQLVPKNAEIMNMVSVTIDTLGISEEVNASGNYNSVRNTFKTLNPETQALEKNRLGAAPDWTVGSVHAITENGTVVIASNTGSQ